MQTGRADPPGRADSPEQRAGLALGHRLPGLERGDRAGVGVLAAGQADLRPLPGRIGLAARDADAQPAGLGLRRNWPPAEATVTSSTFSATSSERRSAPAKPMISSARSRRPRAPSSQVASRRRSIARVSAAAFCAGRP